MRVHRDPDSEGALYVIILQGDGDGVRVIGSLLSARLRLTDKDDPSHPVPRP